MKCQSFFLAKLKQIIQNVVNFYSTAFISLCDQVPSSVHSGLIKGKLSIFRGGNSDKMVLPPFLKGVYSKRKNLLPLGAISFL